MRQEVKKIELRILAESPARTDTDLPLPNHSTASCTIDSTASMTNGVILETLTSIGLHRACFLKSYILEPYDNPNPN